MATRTKQGAAREADRKAEGGAAWQKAKREKLKAAGLVKVEVWCWPDERAKVQKLDRRSEVLGEK